MHGQLYGCNLTDVLKVLDENLSDNNENENKNGYNFTYIKTEVERLLSQLNKSDTCIYKVSSINYLLNDLI